MKEKKSYGRRRRRFELDLSVRIIGGNKQQAEKAGQIIDHSDLSFLLGNA